MPDIFSEAAKLIPKETIGKIYDDVLSPTAKEAGKFGGDVSKTARLILFPLQIAAAFQDRFEKMCERIRQRVPENSQIEPPPELIGPALEKMRYIEDTNELWAMYEEIITRSTDRDKSNTIHPAFIYIIAQLSRDEAWIISELRESNFQVIYTLDFDRKSNKFDNKKIEESKLPIENLYHGDKIDFYYSHLQSLNLVTWPITDQKPIIENNIQIGIRHYSEMMLTDFGKIFATACIPKNGFAQK